MSNEHVIREWLAILGEAQERDAELGSEIYGAILFHQWVTSLPEIRGRENLRRKNLRAHYRERFVLGAHHLVDSHFSTMLAVRNRFYPRPNPSDIPICHECTCKKKGVVADCLLIDEFHSAYKEITAENIVEWYFGLFVHEAINVRAFFRVAAPADSVMLKARDQILSHQLSQREGVTLRVSAEGKRTPPRVRLRDAFALTALVAIIEWLSPSSEDRDAYAAVVAERFGFRSVDRVIEGLASVYPEERASAARR